MPAWFFCFIFRNFIQLGVLLVRQLLADYINIEWRTIRMLENICK